MNKRFILFLSGIGAALVAPAAALAAETGAAAEGGQSHAEEVGLILLFLAVLLLSAKLGSIVERIGIPGVLGEIGAGIVLSGFAFAGWHMIDEMRGNEILSFFSQLGAVILLFQIGLESNIAKMAKVGVNALLVAIIGVTVPFVLGAFLLGPWLFPDAGSVGHLFLGASLVATSVGITAYVFRDMGILKSRPAQVVLGAAVIDDILGLLVLAVVSAIASTGSVDSSFVLNLSVKAFGFLAAAVLLGNVLAKVLSRAFSMVNTGVGMKLTLALTFAFSYAYLATLAGLEPIVGAFAAGLILDAVHFDNFELPKIAGQLKRLRGFDKEERKKINDLIEEQRHGHVEDLIGSLSFLLVPFFFVYTGLQIEFASLLDPQLYVAGVLIAALAVGAKMIAGIAAPGSFSEKLLVGSAMVPRGEVGLIFASVGRGLGVLSDELFSTIIVVIILTTFVAPPMIKAFSKRLKAEEGTIERVPASAVHHA